MNKFLYVILLLFITLIGYSQDPETKYPIIADTVIIMSFDVNGAELYIKNNTQNITNGVLTNIGAGQTQFILPDTSFIDSIYFISPDTLVYIIDDIHYPIHLEYPPADTFYHEYTDEWLSVGDTIDEFIEIDGSITNELDSFYHEYTGEWLTNQDTIDVFVEVDGSITNELDSFYNSYTNEWLTNTDTISAFLEIDGDTTNELDSIYHFDNSEWLSNGDTLTEADGDPTNEFQDLSLGTQVLTQIPINISNGSGVIIDVADFDNSPTNELQTLSISNDTLYLDNGGSIYLGGYSDSLYNTVTNEWLFNGDTIQQPSGLLPDTFYNVGTSEWLESGDTIQGYLTTEIDGDVTNELQEFYIENDTLYLVTDNDTSAGVSIEVLQDSISGVDSFYHEYISQWLYNGDTIDVFLELDDDPTNELQEFYIENDTLYLVTDDDTSGGVPIEALQDSTDEVDSFYHEYISQWLFNGDTIDVFVEIDDDVTNELQEFFIDNDTLYLVTDDDTSAGIPIQALQDSTDELDSFYHEYTNEWLFNGDTIDVFEEIDGDVTNELDSFYSVITNTWYTTGDTLGCECDPLADTIGIRSSIVIESLCCEVTQPQGPNLAGSRTISIFGSGGNDLELRPLSSVVLSVDIIESGNTYPLFNNDQTPPLPGPMITTSCYRVTLANNSSVLVVESNSNCNPSCRDLQSFDVVVNTLDTSLTSEVRFFLTNVDSCWNDNPGDPEARTFIDADPYNEIDSVYNKALGIWISNTDTIQGFIFGATNGLTKFAEDSVKLGGTLVEPTIINGGNNELYLGTIGNRTDNLYGYAYNDVFFLGTNSILKGGTSAEISTETLTGGRITVTDDDLTISAGNLGGSFGDPGEVLINTGGGVVEWDSIDVSFTNELQDLYLANDSLQITGGTGISLDSLFAYNPQNLEHYVYDYANLVLDTITGNQDDRPEFTGTGARIVTFGNNDITGMVGGQDGDVYLIYNIGPNQLRFRHNNVGSSPGNRTFTPSGNILTLNIQASIYMLYDSTIDGGVGGWHFIDSGQ